MLNKHKDTRPINLQIWTIKFPITAMVSILHRLSGFGLFLIIPFLLCSLQHSLVSNDSFSEVKTWFDNTCFKIFFWLILTGLFYHVVAGLRHLLMDMHIGDTKKSGRVGAIGVLIITIIGSLCVGVYLW